MENIRRKRFEEIASGRVNRIIISLQSLEKCSNVYNYEYNEEDVRKMMAVLKKQMDELKLAFDKGLSKEKKEFKF
jgi:hypothetical protein